MHQLGTFAEVAARTSCPLCCVITEAYRKGPVPEGVELTSRIQACWSAISKGSPDACLTVWLIPSNEDVQVELSVRLIGDGYGAGLGYGRRIDSGTPLIAFDLMKSWVHRCENTHSCKAVPLEATRAEKLPVGFMVVDVVENRLIQPGKQCRFIALSYVWGNSVNFKTTSRNLEDLSTVGAFERVWDMLSPSIRDAITVTRRIGERYIWIDSLCIKQEDTAVSAANIEAMDTIYRYALCVFIVADDRAPDLGLVGVDNLKRKAGQYVAKLAPDLTVLARFNHGTFLDRSRYRTRGWTYQEEQLSTRAIIFTNDQAYFTCPHFVYAEDLSIEGDATPDLPSTTHRDLTRFINETTTPDLMYFNSVAAYTARNLTYASDVMNAFSGVEAVQCQAMSSSVVGGLPTAIFDISILWQPTMQSSRRPDFPSWSWSGWDKAVRWLGDTYEGASLAPEHGAERLTSWLRNRTWIVFCSRHRSGRISPVWVPGGDVNQVGCMFWPSSGYHKSVNLGYDRESSTSTNCYGRMGKYKEPLQEAQNQTIPNFEHLGSKLNNSKEAIDALLFKTLMAKYQIQPSTAYLRYGSVDPVWEPKGRVVFHLLNNNGAVSGYILLDESWKMEAGNVFDFLLLSEANYYCEWGRPHENHPYKKFWGMMEYEEFHVMMVQWRTLDNGVIVAERTGIGRLLKEAVADACGNGPVWSDIILV